MKKILTLTTAFIAAALLLSASTVLASAHGTDRSKTRKAKKCIKAKKINPPAIAVLSFLDRTLAEMDAELEALAPIKTTEQRVFVHRSNGRRIVIAFRAHSTTTAVSSPGLGTNQNIDFDNLDLEMESVQLEMSSAPEAGQQINFAELDKEMDSVQASMSQMDDALRAEDERNRKVAEAILKTGIKI